MIALRLFAAAPIIFLFLVVCLVADTTYLVNRLCVKASELLRDMLEELGI